ncbi:MAG: family 1 extracellular solute-binding protein [Paenibacillus sp.]|nr:family 1 extracellular solute-binding protein [Paenibacillus sp.]
MNKGKLILPTVLTAVMLTACSSNDTTGTTPTQAPSAAPQQSPKAVQEPVSFSWSTLLWNEPPNVEQSPFYQELFKRLNAKISYQFVPSSGYTDKINLALSSNTLADVTTVKQTNETTIVNAIRQGAFWDLDSLLGDFSQFPNLKAIPKDIYDFSKVDGKIYGIPNTTGDTANAIVIRKDWLDQLNLKMPTTLEEYEAVLKAFATQDPDKNGKSDTIPLGVSTEYMDMAGSIIAASFGVNKPQLDGDKMQLQWMSSEYKDYLQSMRSWYSNGLLPKEFPVLKFRQEIDLVKQNKVGSFGVPIHEFWGIQEDLKKITPIAELAIIPPMKGKAGNTAYNSSSGYYGAFMIPKSVSKEKALRILQVLDKSASQEINDFFKFGIEGTHYKMVNGEKSMNADLIKKDIGVAYTIVNSYDKYKSFNSITGAPDEAVKTMKSALDQYQSKMGDNKSNPFSGLISDTNNKRSADLFKDLTTMQNKAVMGQITMEQWDEYVANMKKNAEVLKIMQEFAAQYKLMNK